jgi:nucleotide-binding universal stress UspA family protein
MMLQPQPRQEISGRRSAMKLVSPRTRVALSNILLAVDFSPATEAALPFALGIARRYGSKIYLAHVIRPDVYQLAASEAANTVLDEARHSAEKQMARVLVSGRLRGVPHQVLLAQGDLWSVISMMIQEHSIDLVVVGTHGRTGLPKALLGSVAEEVFRLAPCPVLTVGPRVARDLPSQRELRQVVYATDFSASAESAGAYAVSVAQEHQASLTLLHVVSPAVEAGSPLAPDALASHLQALVPPEADLWCKPEFTVEFGEPAEVILKAAEERQADLIVLGVRRTAPSFAHPRAATAYQVVCQAPCPVLTVRSQGGVP